MHESAGTIEASPGELEPRLNEAIAALETAAHVPQAGSALRALRRIEVSLRRPPRIGIFGEFNAGKTSLTNLLIRRKALPTSVVTSDRGSTLLRYAEQPALFAIGADGGRHRLTSAAFQKLIARPALSEINVPFPRLREYEIIDTVGVADPAHGGLPPKRAAHSYVHAAVWCTVASQAWKRSEIKQWRTLPEAVRKRSLLVVTHIDAVADQRDRERIAERLQSEAANLFYGFVMISLPQALRALSSEGEVMNETEWTTSGAADLEKWFSQIVNMAQADKCRRALIAAHTIVERLAQAPSRTRHEIEVSRLQTAWSHRVQRTVEDATAGSDVRTISVERHIAAIVTAARGFSAYNLEPWLERRLKPAAIRSLLSLLPLEHDVVLASVEGLDPDQAHERLSLISGQIATELHEVLNQTAMQQDTKPAALPEAAARALDRFASWASTARRRAP